ncbi:MAG TPA: BlaI/MecI/CopY family transcriptional regulator [Candidatus Didemnitutus sp.]|nr:BlaI/MecI/CopY family transcriptional regulator [Candidatus Didemnitutus sp.]
MPRAAAKSRLSRLELDVMEPLWRLGQASVRELLEALPKEKRVEYTTVQTVVSRLEEKGAVQRVKKIGNAFVFAPVVPRQSAIGALVDELVRRVGGSAPLMSHLVETGRIGLRELKELEDQIRLRKDR